MTASANKQAMVSLAADKDGADQQFTFVKNSDGSFRIASTANKNLVMDTNPTSGAAALLWTQNGTICQDFVAVGEANDAYSFRLANNPSMTLTASGSGVALQAYTGSASPAVEAVQQFGGYRIGFRKAGFYYDGTSEWKELGQQLLLCGRKPVHGIRQRSFLPHV